MRCPVCGHANSDLATRCAGCGAELPPAPLEDATSPVVDETYVAQTTVAPHHMKTSVMETRDATGGAVPTSEPVSETPFSDVDETHVATSPVDNAAGDEPDDDFGSELDYEDELDDEYLEDFDDEDEFDEDFEEDYDELDEGGYEGSGELRRPRKPREHRVATFVTSHQKGLGIGLALVVIVVLGVTWLYFSLAGAPAKTEIANDLSSHLPTYAYTGGTFGPDEEIALSNLTVTRLEPTSVPTQTGSTGIGPSAYLCDAEATYEGESMRATRTVSATYVRTDDGWQMSGDLVTDSATLSPVAGVSTDKMLGSISELLLLAQESTGEDLSSIYAGGSFQVIGERFDDATKTTPATDSVTISCTQASTFYSYEGVLNARFAFEDGTWHLEAAGVEAGATSRNYAPLIGIWEGPAIDHEASAKVCYGAEEVPLSVVIESIGETVGDQTSVTGTIYGIVHAHGELDRQEMSDARDVHIEMVPFEGSLTSGYGSDLTLEATVAYEAPQRPEEEDETAEDEEESEEGGTSSTTIRRTTSATRPDPAGESTAPMPKTSNKGVDGTLDVTFICTFDSTDGTPSVICDLTSTYSYEEVVFLVVPRETQARFTDTYSLTRVS